MQGTTYRPVTGRRCRPGWWSGAFRVVVGGALIVGSLGLMTSTASAHITPQDPTGPSGGYFTTAFKVGHGCDGKPTSRVEIKIPDGVTSVAPQPVAGWNLSVTTRKLDPPLQSEGGELTETTDTVVWDGGSLPSDQLQMFWMSMKLPEAKAGSQVAFPIIQTCGAVSTNWIGIAKDGEPEPDYPAPVVTLTDAGDSAGHGSSESDGGEEPDAVGDVGQNGSQQSEDGQRAAEVDTAQRGSGNDFLAVAALLIAVVGFVVSAVAVFRPSKMTHK